MRGLKQVTQGQIGDVVRLSKARCADPTTERIERFVRLKLVETLDGLDRA